MEEGWSSFQAVTAIPESISIENLKAKACSVGLQDRLIEVNGKMTLDMELG